MTYLIFFHNEHFLTLRQLDEKTIIKLSAEQTQVALHVIAPKQKSAVKSTSFQLTLMHCVNH